MNALKSCAILTALVMLLIGVQTTYASESPLMARPSLDHVTAPAPGADLLGLPDLIVTTPGTQALTASPYFKFTVKNISTNGNTGWSIVAVEALTPTAGFPKTFSVPPLQAGQSYSLKAYVGCNVPFRIVADYGNQYQEWSETNNTYGPVSLCAAID